MYAADLAAIIASLPALTFASAEQAPVSPRWCLVAPGGDHDRAIAHRTKEGWFAIDGLALDPVLFATLPPAAAFKQQYVERVAHDLAEEVVSGRYDRATQLLDRLSDEVRVRRGQPAAALNLFSSGAATTPL